jgi:hypothetical protein
MGVALSSAFYDDDEDQNEVEKARLKLKIDVVQAQKLVDAYILHAYAPMADQSILTSLFNHAIESSNNSDLIDAAWFLFVDDDDQICFIQEVLVCLVLLCDGPWNKRLDCIFELFKCAGIDIMMHEDITLAAQVIASALCRLWRAPNISFDLLSELSEAIADGAFTKLDKELDDGIDRKHFVMWAADRFKENRNVASLESLTSLYQGDALTGLTRLKKKKEEAWDEQEHDNNDDQGDDEQGDDDQGDDDQEDDEQED